MSKLALRGRKCSVQRPVADAQARRAHRMGCGRGGCGKVNLPRLDD